MSVTLLRRDNQRVDVIGPDRTPLPEAIRMIADVLVPQAELVDRDGVQRSAMDALAAAGLLGSPLPPAEQRELGELLAMVDASMWFCWVQHQSPLRELEQSTAEAPRASWLDGLQSGAMLGAVAFAHLRRSGPPNPIATRTEGGWLVSGGLDWVTSWDIADVLMLMVRAADSNAIVTAMIPAGRIEQPRDGMQVGEPLRLLAMSGTHTRPIAFDRVFIADSEVTSIVDFDQWQVKDSIRSADASPAVFGVIRGAVAELDAMGGMDAACRLLADECREIRRTAYELSDRATQENVTERLMLRAGALDLVVRATTAVVIARSGSAMRSGSSAERRVREAMFLQVQAQTEQSRAAGLARIIRAR